MGKDKREGPISRVSAKAQAKDERGSQSQAFGDSQSAMEESPGSGEEYAVALRGGKPGVVHFQTPEKSPSPSDRVPDGANLISPGALPTRICLSAASSKPLHHHPPSVLERGRKLVREF